MGEAVVFITPTLIDIRAFTVFGVNAKPNSPNPIGYFGTGLKYAVAVLCRLGASPVVYIGSDKYTFYAKQGKFRDREFSFIRMKLEKWATLKPRHHDMPYTTELGKNWEAWQAFRELESNTRDEGGTTIVTDDLEHYAVSGEETTIAVEHPAIVEAFRNRDDIFLPGGLTVRPDAGDRVQVLDKPAKAVFYRGLKVQELKKPTLFTYNVLTETALTEDRTIKYEWEVRANLARQVVTSHDEVFIERVLTAPDSTWEHGLEYDFQNEPPSDAFKNVADRRRGAIGRSALRYYSGWSSGSSSRAPRTFEVYPRPWRADGEWAYDDNSSAVLSTSRGVQLMRDVVDAVNSAGDEE